MVGGKKMQYLVWVDNVKDSCILGLDFLRDHGCQFDPSISTLSFRSGQVMNQKFVTPMD